MKLEVEQETMQKIANYLVRRPFGEVVNLIQLIDQCKPIKEKEPEDALD